MQRIFYLEHTHERFKRDNVEELSHEVQRPMLPTEYRPFFKLFFKIFYEYLIEGDFQTLLNNKILIDMACIC